MNIDHTFVINLDHRPDRWQKIQNDFKDTGLKLEKWNAIYGKNLDETTIQEVTTDYCNNFCTYGIIGCWLSHYTLWQYIVKNNLDNVLILEDDAIPLPDFNNKLNETIIPTNYDLVYIGYFNIFDCTAPLESMKQDKNAFINGVPSDNLIIPRRPIGLHGYLISNKGAQILTNCPKLKKITHGIDLALSDYIYADDNIEFNMYALKEPQITQITDTNNSDLVNNYHPILNYILSQVKINDSLDMGYITQCPLLSIRKTGIDINVLMMIFVIGSLLMGLFLSKETLIYILIGIIIIFVLEYLVIKKKNSTVLLAELGIIIGFIFIGQWIAKLYKSKINK